MQPSECIRNVLRASKFPKISWRCMPPDPPPGQCLWAFTHNILLLVCLRAPPPHFHYSISALGIFLAFPPSLCTATLCPTPILTHILYVQFYFERLCMSKCVVIGMYMLFRVLQSTRAWTMLWWREEILFLLEKMVLLPCTKSLIGPMQVEKGKSTCTYMYVLKCAHEWCVHVHVYYSHGYYPGNFLKEWKILYATTFCGLILHARMLWYMHMYLNVNGEAAVK